MQSSSNRDKYVDILWENIAKNFRHNFKKYDRTVNYGIPYDYESIMQYPRDAFTKNGLDTMRAKVGAIVSFVFIVFQSKYIFYRTTLSNSANILD